MHMLADFYYHKRIIINTNMYCHSVLVVTGSTDGIGKAYAKELASRNMNLILISRTLEKLEKTKSEILQINPKVEVKVIAMDFSKGKDIFSNIETELKDIPIGILGKKNKE
jgi:17beta-estradiol 17-dehydrogenase / very-long-chain 3-oxoacyl-CoA reductase